MSLGRLARSLLGDRGSRVAGNAYRALFVDMAKATRAIAREIPTGAHVLDVGGGDGAPLNPLLALRPDIRVTTIDVVDAVGQWIDDVHFRRIVRLPRTTLRDYLASSRETPDVLLMSDVMHHIPPSDREPFLGVVAELVRRSPDVRIIVKDVEPGHLRARLGYWSDRYITGDRSVSPVSRRQLVASMERVLGGIRWSETELFAQDKPNYALVFRR